MELAEFLRKEIEKLQEHVCKRMDNPKCGPRRQYHYGGQLSAYLMILKLITKFEVGGS